MFTEWFPFFFLDSSPDRVSLARALMCRTHARDPRPFFLYLAPPLVHAPFQNPNVRYTIYCVLFILFNVYTVYACGVSLLYGQKSFFNLCQFSSSKLFVLSLSSGVSYLCIFLSVQAREYGSRQKLKIRYIIKMLFLFCFNFTNQWVVRLKVIVVSWFFFIIDYKVFS